MLTATAGYRAIAADIDKALVRISKDPGVQRESAYYLSRISEIDTIEQFIADDRVYQFAMRAHGLEDMIFAKAYMRKVLTEGVDNRSSFANRLADTRFRDFAATFNFARYGSTTTSFSRTQQGTVDSYVRQTLESNQGNENQGIRLALYFERKAPEAVSAFSLLADRALLKVTQVALGLSESTAALDVDRQADLIKKKLDVADLKDPAKLDKMLTRFTALWDIENPATTSTLAPNLLIGGSSSIFDNDLLSRIQAVRNGR